MCQVLVMRPVILFVAALALLGCGYPGPPLPPALNRPVTVRDLSVVEHGSKILIAFTVPKLTTEGLPIPGTPDIELRIGPLPAGAFQFPAWEHDSERIPPSAIHVDNGAAAATLDASKFYGKTEVLLVRVNGPHGHVAGWSNPGQLAVVPALAMPEALGAADIADAVRLDWHAAAPAYRVFRKLPDDTDWTQIGTSDKPSYDDTTIEYGRTYQYRIQSIEKTDAKAAESEVSAAITFKPTDRFPPAVPTGLTVVPGTRTIELVWDRNTEKDLASYRVYRDGQKVANGFSAPAYSDRDVKAGTSYRYQVSAVDTSGNESALSTAVEGTIP